MSEHTNSLECYPHGKMGAAVDEIARLHEALEKAEARIRELEIQRNDYMSLAVKYCHELRNIERERVKVMGEF